MTDYTDLIRCLRDCFGFPTETDYTCDCDNCVMRDKIEEHSYEDGEPFYSDYTKCESALALAAADAIEALMDKLKRREDVISTLVRGISDAKAAIADVLDRNQGGIISE